MRQPSNTVETHLKELIYSRHFNPSDRIHIQLIYRGGEKIISFKHSVQNILPSIRNEFWATDTYISATGLLPMHHDPVIQRDVYIVQFTMEEGNYESRI